MELQFKSSKYRVVNKKVLHKSQEKMHQKIKMTLQRAKNSVYVKQRYGLFYSVLWCFFLQKKKTVFPILFYTADMAIWMSNIDNFDIDQMSSKFGQR